MGKRKHKVKKSNTGQLIAGSLLVGEGALLALYGTRYIDFMDRCGLLDSGKSALKRMEVQSKLVLATLGFVEALWGIDVVRKAHA